MQKSHAGRVALGTNEQIAGKLRTVPSPLLEIKQAHKRRIRALDFSLDGRMLVSGSDDKTVRLWNVQDGTLAGVMSECPWGVETVTFSPDGRTVALVCRGAKKPVK